MAWCGGGDGDGGSVCARVCVCVCVCTPVLPVECAPLTDAPGTEATAAWGAFRAPGALQAE